MRGETGKNDIQTTTDCRQKTKLVVKNPSKLFPDESHDNVKSSEKADSPLRQALSTMTPLLAATLNTPPVHLVNPFPTSSPPPLTAVDLSQSSCQRNESPSFDTHTARHIDEGHSVTNYPTLLLNSREKATKDINGNQSIKLSAAARREKLKLQPSFQCPVCKKRFQRHIAMSAHFQNEHIGNNSKTSEKYCKLCSSFSNADIVLLRKHLLTCHKIDLENPVSCLVDAERTTSSSPIIITKVPSSPTSVITFSSGKKNGRKRAMNRSHSPDDDSSSTASSLSDNITSSTTSSSSVTPEQRLSPPVIQGQILVKSEPLEEEATDLTIPKATEANRLQLSPLKRAKSTSPIQDRGCTAKRAKIESKQKQKLPVPAIEDKGVGHKYQCHHCQITFPNQTLYFLHRGFHSDIDPWKCNGCGHSCVDMYDFNTHLVSVSHN